MQFAWEPSPRWLLRLSGRKAPPMRLNGGSQFFIDEEVASALPDNSSTHEADVWDTETSGSASDGNVMCITFYQ